MDQQEQRARIAQFVAAQEIVAQRTADAANLTADEVEVSVEPKRSKKDAPAKKVVAYRVLRAALVVLPGSGATHVNAGKEIRDPHFAAALRREGVELKEIFG